MRSCLSIPAIIDAFDGLSERFQAVPALPSIHLDLTVRPVHTSPCRLLVLVQIASIMASEQASDRSEGMSEADFAKVHKLMEPL